MNTNISQPYPKLLIEVESHREQYIRLYGTPESLRLLLSALQPAVASLPSSVSERQKVIAIYAADASGSKREVYFSIHAEPSLDYLTDREKRNTFLDYLIVPLLAAVLVFAVIGVLAVLNWLL